MDEAATTWALVVGIDEYDRADLRRLEGAVADAVDALRWLCRLGVPDDHVFLHLAPVDPAKLGALELPYATARKADLDASIAKLRKVTGGTRLFVFLCGHGLYEPAGGRLFPPQDAGRDDMWVNLGLDPYATLFRTMSFRRQVPDHGWLPQLPVPRQHPPPH